MKSKIYNNIELTVEEQLKNTIKALNSNKHKAIKVGAWVFNSEYGTHIYKNNARIKKPNNFNQEEISNFHAERLCIKSLPKEFKEKGTNTLFVTLIPCKYCVEFLKKQDIKLNVIYFVDPFDKLNNKKYKEISEGLNMIKYVNKGISQTSKTINKLIKNNGKYIESWKNKS